MSRRALRRTGNHIVDLWIDAWRFRAVRCASESAVSLSGESVLMLLSGDASVCRPTALWPSCGRVPGKVKGGGVSTAAVTYVTAYCAKERYSTSTSSPLLSSFRNSLTHLQGNQRGGFTSRTHPKKNLHRLCSKTEQWGFFYIFFQVEISSSWFPVQDAREEGFSWGFWQGN